jgi:hypothetical protein
MTATFAFEFSEHLDSNTATSLMNTMLNLGAVEHIGPGRNYRVEVFRPSRFERARIALNNFEISGFLTWHEVRE